jgi:ABC-type sugar transport system ATPase subunit
MQRISIGRALVRDPHLILFDEPLSHLDGNQRVQLRTEIKRLQKTRGVTSILVTHDQTEATAMADRIAVMNLGVLQQVDTPAVLYQRPANVFVANFIGEPPMNMLGGRVEGEGETLSIRALDRSITLDPRRKGLVSGLDGTLTIGIRPEHVRVFPQADGSRSDAIVRYRESRGDTDSLFLSPTTGPDTTIMVEVPGPASFRDGDSVRIDLPVDRLHLFDSSTGRNVECLS